MVQTRYFFLAVAFLLITACSGSGSSNDRAGVLDSMQAQLDSDWSAYASGKPGFGGGVAMQILSPAGEFFLTTGMGNAVKNYSRFRSASTTKTFTAAAIMLLHQQGLIDIHDCITDAIPGTSEPYVPDTADYNIPYKDQITIKMLLMHWGGVFDVANSNIPEEKGPPYGGKNYIDYVKEGDPYHQFTFDELLGIVAQYQLSDSAPGVKYHYSNTGYSLLGKIIERVSGVNYNDFIRDEFIFINGLFDTSLVVNSHQIALPSPFVPGYYYTGDSPLVDVTEDNLTANVAEGNLITTPYDLALWCRMLLSGEAGLTKDTVEMMKQAALPQKEGSSVLYGLGLEYVPGLGWGHGGAHQGYLTDMYHNTDTGITTLMFTNVWNITDGKNSLSVQALYMRDMSKRITDLLN
jgi:D-alanyl-D-alanine carboxypeptidase